MMLDLIVMMSGAAVCGYAFGANHGLSWYRDRVDALEVELEELKERYDRVEGEYKSVQDVVEEYQARTGDACEYINVSEVS